MRHDPNPTRSTRSQFAARCLALAGLLLACTAGAAATASASGERATPDTPSACIRANRGDFTACNVGNSGGGDRAYRAYGPAGSSTPDDCIRANRGDFNACNVGNSGRGDRPYLPVR